VVKTTNGNLDLVQTTNFALPTDVDGQCLSQRGKFKTVGVATDMRVIGTTATTKPTSTMVTIIKQKALQFFGVSSRNAGSFDVCLGAMYLDGPSTGTQTSAQGAHLTTTSGTISGGWRGKDRKAKQTTALLAADVDGLWRWWSVPADCTASFVRANYDPCIQLKTKSASALAAQLTASTGQTWTVSDVNSKLNYFDGDVAIVQRHPFPWDGKAGSFPS
jgi:hypothetical protein